MSTFFGSNSTSNITETNLGSRLYHIKEAAIGSESIVSILPDDNVVVNNCSSFGKSLLNVSTLNQLVGLINSGDSKVEVIDSGTGEIVFSLDNAVKMSVRNAYTEVLNELRSLNIIPATDLEYNLGTSSKRYGTGFIRKITTNSVGQVSIGDGTGTGGISSVNIGNGSGGNGEANYSVSIGRGANSEQSHSSSICLGYASGQKGTQQRSGIIAIGHSAGTGISSVQGMMNNAIAIGSSASLNGGAVDSIAIGAGANGNSVANDYSIAIGSAAGSANQGNHCIAIGRLAGSANQHNNTIIINGQNNTALNSGQANSLYIAPIRSGGTGNNLVYDTGTKEVQVGGVASMSGITTSGHITPDSSSQRDLGANGTRFRTLYTEDISLSGKIYSTTTATPIILAQDTTERARINASGQLEVKTATISTGAIKISTPSQSLNQTTFIGFSGDGSDGNDRARFGCRFGNTGGGNLFFTTGGSGTQADRMVITDTGVQVNGNIIPDSTANVREIGASGNKFNNVFSTTFTGALSGNASSATFASIPDTRFVSPFNPKRPTASVAEFRARQQQEINELCEAGAANANLGVGNFWGISKTIVPWSDPSGGRMYQYYYSANGIVYFRKSDQASPYNTEAWTAWRDASPDKCILTDSTDTISGTKTFSSNILFDADNQRNVGSSGQALNSVFAHTGNFKSIAVHSATAGNIGTSAKAFNTLFVSTIGSSGTPVQTLYADVWATSSTSGLRCANNLVLATDLALPTITWYDVNAKSMILVDTVNTTNGGKLSYDSANSEIVIATTSSNVERVRIGANGLKSKRAIHNTDATSGITSTDSQLQLSGATKSQILFENTGNTSKKVIALYNSADKLCINSMDNTGTTYTASGDIIQFDMANGWVIVNALLRPTLDLGSDLGGTNKRWANGYFDKVYTTSGTVNTSDRNQKKDIQPLGDSLKQLLKLEPVSFKYKEGTSGRTHLGFIAQQVAEVIPDCAIFVQNGDSCGLRYEQFSALIVKAVQELHSKVEKIEARKLVGGAVIDTSGLTEDFVRVYERLDFLESEVNKPVKPSLHRCVELSRINELYDRISNLECNEQKSSSSEDFELMHSLIEKNHQQELRINELENKLNQIQSQPKVEFKDSIEDSDAGGLSMIESLQDRLFKAEQLAVKQDKMIKKLTTAVNKLLKQAE